LKDLFKLIKAFVRILLVVLFFPMSLVFIAYFKQRSAKKAYFSSEDDE
jgi:hypothetical protein